MKDRVTIDLQLIKAKKDFFNWSIQHEIFKNENILAAVITIDGSCFDTVKRKLIPPPQIMIDVFNQMPKHENFQWLD